MGRTHRAAPDGPRRLGGFRTAAVLVLALGATGGVYLGVNRHQEADKAADPGAYSVRAQIDSMDQHTLYKQKVATDEVVAAAQKKAATAAAAAAARARAAEEKARQEKASRSQERKTTTTTKPTGPTGGSAGPVPASCKSYTGNKAIGCTLLLEFAGFKLDQMPCLDKLWMKESRWTTTAKNKSSGAYGIPQSLPASKMAKYGSDYLTNPVPQIKWGLGYIKGRYDTPCGAWTFFQNNGFY